MPDVVAMFSVRYADKQSQFAFYELSKWPLNRQVMAIIDSIWIKIASPLLHCHLASLEHWVRIFKESDIATKSQEMKDRIKSIVACFSLNRELAHVLMFTSDSNWVGLAGTGGNGLSTVLLLKLEDIFIRNSVQKCRLYAADITHCHESRCMLWPYLLARVVMSMFDL